MPPAAIFYIIEPKNAAQYRQTAAPTAERLNAKPKERISRVMSENAPQRPTDPPCVWNASENTSLFQEPAVEFKCTLSPQCDVAIGVFLIITGSLSLLGNGVVVITFSRRCKRLKPPELMAVNLAVCDFGYSLLGAPLLIYSSFSHAWWFGWRGCRWYGVQGFVFGIGSLLTTMLISIDCCLKICSIRYGQWVEQSHVALLVLLVWIYTTAWAILPVLGFGTYGPEPFGISCTIDCAVCPLFAGQWVEQSHVALLVLLVWIYTTAWAILPVLGFGTYGPEPFGISCTIDWWKIGSSPLDRLYVILIMVFCFGVPVLTIILCYLKIIWEVRASSRSLAEISASDVTAIDKEMRLTKIAAVICLSFLLAWTPYVIVSLYSMLLPSPPAPLSSDLPSLCPPCSLCEVTLHAKPVHLPADEPRVPSGCARPVRIVQGGRGGLAGGLPQPLLLLLQPATAPPMPRH
ncbi:UNVERIFIED_CONTAM: hypothetical protein FKN15_070611 [Acipenser sinensis]